MGGDGAPGRCRIEGCGRETELYRGRFLRFCPGHHVPHGQAKLKSWRERTAPTAEEVDWLALSPEGRETLRTVAVLITTGVQTHAEIGAALGVTSDEVSRRMRNLREEIRAQAERDGEGATG